MPKRHTKARTRFVALVDELRRRHPELDDPIGAIRAGHVLVDGAIGHNPARRVRADASIVVQTPRVLRGTTKLQAALEAFPITIDGRVALDVGAASGGFT